uniref:Protein Wnt n=1 Tax=Laticauda laticaudata TaxID=8630 RepID=A0A8C5WTY2_LATLA
AKRENLAQSPPLGFHGCGKRHQKRPFLSFLGCKRDGEKWTLTGARSIQHCKQLEGLVVSQVQLCRSNLELMQTIIQAAREVIKTCRKAFSDMRWNCSSIERAPNYLLDLERGTRESAFVYALSAAAISHTIARACTTGDLPGCSCGPIPGETPGPGGWGALHCGCQHACARFWHPTTKRPFARDFTVSFPCHAHQVMPCPRAESCRKMTPQPHLSHHRCPLT